MKQGSIALAILLLTLQGCAGIGTPSNGPMSLPMDLIGWWSWDEIDDMDPEFGYIREVDAGGPPKAHRIEYNFKRNGVLICGVTHTLSR